MRAVNILREMSKSRSMLGYAAGLYTNDEIRARGFLAECYHQYRNKAEDFIASFGEKTYLDFRIFWMESNN